MKNFEFRKSAEPKMKNFLMKLGYYSIALCKIYVTRDGSQSFHGWIKMPTFIWDLENVFWIITINLGAYVLIVGRICPRLRISAFRQQNDYGSFRVNTTFFFQYEKIKIEISIFVFKYSFAKKTSFEKICFKIFKDVLLCIMQSHES